MFDILGLLVLIIPFAYLFEVVLNHESKMSRLETKVGLLWEAVKICPSHSATSLRLNALSQNHEPIAGGKMLGRRSIESTMICTQLIKYEDIEYHTTTARTKEEKIHLFGEGWEFICQDATDGLMYFRKRK